ncbi:MAG: FxLYD domain-containing protein, partial [Sphingomicrobium sp.]
TEWKAKLGLAETTTPLQLSNPPHVERRPLASGQDLLTVAGRVINPTDQAHPVPPIYAELYDHGGKVIYSWTIAPPTPTLGPGASASFNSAEINVPAGAEGVTISLGPPKA